MIPVDTSNKKHRNINSADTKGHVYDVTNVVNSPMTLYKIQQAGMGLLSSSLHLPSRVIMTTLTTPFSSLLSSIAIYIEMKAIMDANNDVEDADLENNIIAQNNMLFRDENLPMCAVVYGGSSLAMCSPEAWVLDMKWRVPGVHGFDTTAKSRTRTALHESIEWSQRTEYPKESALGDAVDTVMKRSQSDAIISYPPTMHPSGSTGALDTLTLNNLMAMASEGIAMGRQQITLDSHTYKALMNAFLQGKNSSFSPSPPSSFFFCFNHNNSTTYLR